MCATYVVMTCMMDNAHNRKMAFELGLIDDFPGLMKASRGHRSGRVS